MPPKHHRSFPSVAHCHPSGRSDHAVAADLDGTLLVSRSSFPYFMLLAVEAGSLPRGLLLLILSPLILFLYKLVSEAAGIQVLIFVAVAGVPFRDIDRVSRTVLPKFYAADVRDESWGAFRACGRRRVVVTANPTVMVEPFVKGWLGGDKVLGTELEVDGRSGRATGFVKKPGVLVGGLKREAVVREFAAAGRMPELGLGDRESDHDFMALCKDGYMVLPDPKAAKVPLARLCAGTESGGDDVSLLVRRPEPGVAFKTFLWLPFGFALAVVRVISCLLLSSPLLRLTGVRLLVRGTPPRRTSPGSLLFVSTRRRTAADSLLLSAALGRRVTSNDADVVPDLLKKGDVAVYQEETTVAAGEVVSGHRVVPVEMEVREAMFRAAVGKGWRRWMGVCIFFMNPRPTCEVTFLDLSYGEEVASRAESVGNWCRSLTRKDE